MPQDEVAQAGAVSPASPVSHITIGPAQPTSRPSANTADTHGGADNGHREHQQIIPLQAAERLGTDNETRVTFAARRRAAGVAAFLRSRRTLVRPPAQHPFGASLPASNDLAPGADPHSPEDDAADPEATLKGSVPLVPLAPADPPASEASTPSPTEGSLTESKPDSGGLETLSPPERPTVDESEAAGATRPGDDGGASETGGGLTAADLDEVEDASASQDAPADSGASSETHADNATPGSLDASDAAPTSTEPDPDASAQAGDTAQVEDTAQVGNAAPAAEIAQAGNITADQPNTAGTAADAAGGGPTVHGPSPVDDSVEIDQRKWPDGAANGSLPLDEDEIPYGTARLLIPIEPADEPRDRGLRERVNMLRTGTFVHSPIGRTTIALAAAAVVMIVGGVALLTVGPGSSRAPSPNAGFPAADGTDRVPATSSSTPTSPVFPGLPSATPPLGAQASASSTTLPAPPRRPVTAVPAPRPTSTPSPAQAPTPPAAPSTRPACYDQLPPLLASWLDQMGRC
ncbi:hypothetical protein [Pseudofrankia sp. BMG5.36]|uniref:hypothetical protein n=1 Tax=Pseudofrankia sp. BMG5.36 TaxID=1834512 RepID=UPI0010427C33|nr:hypothetical protein [Pseudofrankia sp. BMG5.36]